MFPPLGLMAVGAGLRQQGHEVTLYDGELEDLPLDYQAYGFGPTAPEYPHALATMRRIKERNPKARCVIGGPHATLDCYQCRDDGFDSVVIGDGEVAAGRAFTAPAQLMFAPEKPLNEYPSPDRTLVNLRDYHFTIQDRPATTIIGSRGCPFQCGFCTKNYTSVRLRSAGAMIAEIQELESMGYDALAFPEDIFIWDRKRTEEVCAYLKRCGIIWRCLVRADVLVDKILSIVRKGETVATIRAAVAMLQQAEIYTKGFFIVGLPGETKATLAETDKFLEEVGFDDIDCKIFQPYPGSPIYDNREQYDIQWQDIPLEGAFYKGRPAEYFGNLSTAGLTSEEIVEAWKYLEGKYKQWQPAGEVPCLT
jgi:anaerobic magnesium-protoporphyrin IX monomethyl ester cyclase